MSKYISMIMAGALVLTAVAATGSEPVRRLQATLQEWVEVEKAVSEEENNWLIERQLIGDSIAVLTAQRDTFEERKAAAEETTSRAAAERLELAEERESLEAVSRLTEETVRAYERQMLDLIPRLPDPLRQELSAVTRRIPRDPEDTSLGLSVRVQNLVAVLSQVDRFNTTVTKVSEIRDLEEGAREVSTLYFGLAVAYFVDQTGSFAGYGLPGADGWEWRTDTSLSGPLRNLMAVYEGTREAQFIALPVSIR
ncbi:MAG: DUF3450 family protein [Opitutales bacterium]|nr:DUF3450 family protein [Opitutales bacterium]